MNFVRPPRRYDCGNGLFLTLAEIAARTGLSLGGARARVEGPKRRAGADILGPMGERAPHAPDVGPVVTIPEACRERPLKPPGRR